MANPEEVKRAIDILPLEEADREKIYENIDQLAALIDEVAPLEYLQLPRIQDEITRIMEYAQERQAFLEKRSNMRKWIGRLLPLYGVGLGALAASVEWSPSETDTTYLERLAGQPSGQLIVTFILLTIIWNIGRKSIDAQSQADIDQRVFEALAKTIEGSDTNP